MKTAGTFEIESLDERKTMLMDHIANVPGMRYRELLKVSGFSNGVLFYHLTGLEEAGLIRVERKRAKKNYKILSNQYFRNRICHSLLSKAQASERNNSVYFRESPLQLFRYGQLYW